MRTAKEDVRLRQDAGHHQRRHAKHPGRAKTSPQGPQLGHPWPDAIIIPTLESSVSPIEQLGHRSRVLDVERAAPMALEETVQQRAANGCRLILNPEQR